MSLTVKQFETLSRPLNRARVAKRSQGGKQLSYLEAWDVKAHLIRVFGYCNFDAELIDYGMVAVRDYVGNGEKPMTEAIWHARVRLIVRDPEGNTLATYTEGAVGSASGPENMISEQHDNALKTAESDALKRCAINLGNQFGLSLYDDGTTADVIKGTVVTPEGWEPPKPVTDEQAQQNIAHSLGGTPVNSHE